MEEQMPSLEASTKADIDRIFALQQSYKITLRKTDWRQRLPVLERFERVFKASYTELYRAAATDFSKSETEVDAAEILPVLSELKHTRKKLKSWMKPRSVRPTLATFGTRSKIVTEPKGVSLIISPWNYPFNLTFTPMISAIAAGNTVIIKPSEMTPAMSAVIVDIVSQVFKPEEVCVFEGDASVASYLTSLPFDHIFFTGSPAVGKHVMAAAAKNLTSVTLELGGKTPVIVDQSANLKKAAASISYGKFTNNGQTCIAPDYIYVHQSVKDEFLAELTSAVADQYGDESAMAENPDYCRVVNQSHYQRIQSLLQSAVADGAKVIAGGQSVDNECFIAPTLLADVSTDSTIMQQEIFGPVLPIMTYSNTDDVIAFINNNPKPLALYLFSSDKKLNAKVLQETSAGDTSINATLLHSIHPNLPFGGVNNSGIGKSRGYWGYMAFSHERSVLEDKFSSSAILFPPYTGKVRKMIKMTLRLLS
jgi:aldehyde dehydrogenase (NAD+)